MSNPTVSAVCVSYNCAELLRATLASLAAQEVAGGMEIVVVDNASTDESVAVARSFPAMKVIVQEHNAGFAAANNAGVRETLGSRLLFVNPDVEVPAGVVAALSKFMAARPQAAAVGPKLVGRDGVVQRFCARRFPNAAQLVLQVAGWGETRWAAAPWLHNFEPPAFYHGAPAQTQALAGAFMMVRRDTFEEVQGFDEGYFLYGEDVDLCRRLGEAGGEIWYVPVGPVWHFTGGSRPTPNPLVVAASHRAAERYARKWHGAFAAAAVATTSALSLALRRALWLLPGIANKKARAAGNLFAYALRCKRRLKVGA